MGLYAALFGVDFLFGADLRVFGVYDADTERFALSRYGRLIAWHQARVFATYVALGAISGGAIALLLTLWERSGVWPRRHRAHSASTPVHLPPSPWSASRRAGCSVALGLFAHLLLCARAIQGRPALFAEALYDRGGLARYFMLSLTHGRGYAVWMSLGLGLFIFLLVAPLSAPRGRAWVASLLRPPRRSYALTGAALLAALLGARYALQPDLSSPPRPSAGSAGPARPSVLLIAIDSLRADRLENDDRSRRMLPTLSGLASRGVAFDSARVTVPRTFPSIVTLLTGRYPHQHGIRTMFPTLAERAAVPPALPAMLRSAGYRTAALSDFCGEIFSRIDLGFDRAGVPEFDARSIVLQRSLTVHKNLLSYLATDWGRTLGHRVFPELDSLAEIADAQKLADQAIDVLADSRRTGQPFFLTVFFSSAHFPYAAPAPYYRRHTDPAYRGPFRYHKPPLSDPQNAADLAQVRGLYDGALAAADDGVRRILDGLHNLGLDDQTIVVVLADHGENLYDEPGRGMGHGDHLEGDPSLRVPLVIYDPIHRFPPHRVPGIVRDIDVVPTLLSLLRVQPGPTTQPLDGRDLAPLLRGEQTSLGLSSFHETELWFTPSGPGFQPDQRLPYPPVTATTAVDAHDDIALTDRFSDLVTVAKHRALRTEDWKLIYRPTRAGPRFSLFDVHRDPHERTDVSATHPAELRALRESLFQIVALDPKVTVEGGFILPR